MIAGALGGGLLAPAGRGPGQRRCPPRLVNRVDARAVSQQRPHHVDMPMERGNMQARVTLAVLPELLVDIDPSTQEEVDHICAAVHARQGEGVREGGARLAGWGTCESPFTTRLESALSG